MPGNKPKVTAEYQSIKKVYIITFLIIFVMLFVLVYRGDFSVLILIFSPVVLLIIPVFNKLSLDLKLINYKWLIVLIILNSLIIAPELFLRLIDFNFGPSVSYGNLAPQFTKIFIPDKELMWKYSADKPGVNSDGFRGREINRPKPPRTIRIIFLGDSCAEQNYAEILERSLNKNKTNADINYECLVLAVAGYSSYQGKIMAEKYVKMLDADLAFVSFGWNDHWLSFSGKSDEQFANETDYTTNSIIYNLRILQLTRRIIASIIDTNQKELIDIVRVPINRYRDNINAITGELEKNGTEPILITAPTTFYDGNVSDYIINSGLATDKNSAITKHREYNQVVRDIANGDNLHLLDAEKIIDQLNNPDSLFLRDGIHFSSSGLKYMASLIQTYLAKNRLIL